MSSNRKRVYESGVRKRAEKKRKIEGAAANTKLISLFFEKSKDQDLPSSSLPPQGEIVGENVTSSVPDESHETPDENHENVSQIITQVTPCQFDLSKSYPTDRGHFCEDLHDADLKKMILQYGSCRPGGSFEYIKEDGSVSSNFSARYYNKHVKGISIPRLWLCYSMELKKPYCEVCWLFADRSLHNYESQRGWVNGVDGTGRNLLGKIKRHENTHMHVQAAPVYAAWKAGKNFDEKNEEQIRKNFRFWVKVLHRIVTIILTLASLSLAFRSHKENLKDGYCEGGNFLDMVALLAEYDEVLAEVVSFPARTTNYLSAAIQNKLIELLARSVRSSLVGKINTSPFCSIILDSISDISRVDQLSVVVRWVQIVDDKCSVVERFMGFVKITNPDAKGVASTARTFIESLGIDFHRIRGQGYDGATVISGVHSGVQTLIKEMVSFPVPFVHCGCHNLNLVINDAVDSVMDNRNFFDVLGAIFSFSDNL